MWIAAPGVHRTNRPSSIAAKAVTAIAASILAGGVAGSLLGFLGSHMKTTLSPLVLATSLWLLVAAAIGMRLPQVDRETSQSLLNRGPLVWASINGGLLGVAITSRIGFISWYLVPLSSLASQSAVLGALIWGLYGAARLSVTAWFAYVLQQTQGKPMPMVRTVLGMRPYATRALRIAAALGAGVLIVFSAVS